MPLKIKALTVARVSREGAYYDHNAGCAAKAVGFEFALCAQEVAVAVRFEFRKMRCGC
jgi:hypothetical protein